MVSCYFENVPIIFMGKRYYWNFTLAPVHAGTPSIIRHTQKVEWIGGQPAPLMGLSIALLRMINTRRTGLGCMPLAVIIMFSQQNIESDLKSDIRLRSSY